MRPHLILAILVALAGPPGPAHARDGSFTVSVQVVDRRRAAAVLDAIPVPREARAFGAGGNGRSYAYPGTPESAATFFDSELSRLGYRALSREGGDARLRQVWSDDRSRLVLDLRRAPGSAALTRIRLDVSALPRETPRSGARSSGAVLADASAP